MPKLSLWRQNKTNDYKMIDRVVSEMYTVGGTDVLVHKYLGPMATTDSDDATQPNYTNQSEKNIQDLLFLENRDRKYDSSIYQLRGHYQVPEQTFDLSQFGLFLSAGTLFMTFHLNDMIACLGRKLMNGDVLELMHLKDYTPLDETTPVALKRYYVISDATRATEGYSPTWWSHIWRVKLNPLTDSQEYKDILDKISEENGGGSLADLISTYKKYSDINDSIIEQAEKDVPLSGYDTSGIYIKAVNTDISPGTTANVDSSSGNVDTTGNTITTGSATLSPDKKVHGYLTGDGIGPNGLAVRSGISFPFDAAVGDYFLRLDYLPNRLFRFDGRRWNKIEDVLRANLTPGVTNTTLRSTFINNDRTFTDGQGQVQPERQNLADIFKPRSDN